VDVTKSAELTTAAVADLNLVMKRNDVIGSLS
jgi:hypothetical protein